ncbi:MAG: FG-GAP repeat domain-containing protein [Planctomycetota bacterium]
MSVRRVLLTVSVIILSCFSMALEAEAYSSNPFVIKLNIPGPKDSGGGIITADINNDRKMDYLVTVPGHLAAYDNNGKKLWIKKTDIVVGGSSENQGLPGHCGPGVAAGDVDGDGKCEVVYLTKDSFFHILDGKTGAEKANAKPPPGRDRLLGSCHDCRLSRHRRGWGHFAPNHKQSRLPDGKVSGRLCHREAHKGRQTIVAE